MTTTASTSGSTSAPARRRSTGLGVAGWSGRGIAGVVLVVFALFFVVPIVWVLFAVTKTGGELIRQGPFTVGSFGSFAANWDQLFSFQDGAVYTWFGNSVLYALGALVLTLVISIPAGYALALTEFRGRRVLLVLTLVVMLMPSTALVLPVFLEMNALGLVGTALSVILPFSFYPFGVYLAFIYFSTSIPDSLLAAARLDGANELQVFFRVALPLAAPVVALVGFFSFTQNWNNYFLPFVMLPSSDSYPLQVGLSTLLSSTPAFNPSSAGSESVQLPTLALGTVVSVLPILIVFLFSQRFLVEGMTAGGTKE
ncbi:carbohydrate ABC transporter permease [Amnibacterium setariae]|uniref:Carbohydrate ABC transporter permease n=1 Tax=Amnibacterium setariae TaxID=2306585 RepID=A0A3A1TY48_9MICO|nr:carbohydrate ABC transporter permease [Amnibacterium setariae]RIX28501.1 carbohydrate ABC transporter permease [Amnibacterium setariae]